jgi:MoxR-like ATPase
VATPLPPADDPRAAAPYLFGAARAQLRVVPDPQPDEAPAAAPGLSKELQRALTSAGRLSDNIAEVVRGKQRDTKLVLTALACRGHVFLEDVPGTAKTVLARAVAQSIEGAESSRIQCTPDLMPTDVTGLSIYNQKTREFEFQPGPVFAHVVLVDEINRALPKTQSALLEAMAERQVTVGGDSWTLPDPFLLIATANPVEQEGTFPLPEAQLDRFFLRSSLGYPSAEDELQILDDQLHGHPLAQLQPAVSVSELLELQRAVESVYVRGLLKRWIVGLVRATRELPEVDLGASVRASLALERAARAWALLSGRDHVLPEDVEALFLPVVAHRLLFAPRFETMLRDVGREEALQVLYDRCLELAPRPEPQQWQQAD